MKSNTLTRIIVSLVAIPLIIFLCYYGRLPFLAFATFIGVSSYYEFYKMIIKKSAYANKYLGFVAVFIIMLNSYFKFIDFETIVYSIVLFVLLIELFRNKNSAIFNSSVTLLGIFYVGLFASSLVNIRELYNNNNFIYDRGGLIIISVLIIIWVCDSAAFFIGSALGKHKLFKRVSPNKSWEGAIAGFVFSIISVIALKSFLIDFLDWQDVIAIGIITGIFGQIGDLIESLLKRDSGVKDSSSIIPGHGGIFDRFDSLLFASPIIFIYLKYMSNI
ncbi:MAG TPA: phosphatidate cytidylyltransferase [Melioribacteraceae bacterium]|nr:phosphatidate cytidylyltransferase [Melioribacteraceae bacterium]